MKPVAGDNVGVLLRGIEKDQVETRTGFGRSRVDYPHVKFKGEIYILSKERRGASYAFLQQLSAAVLCPYDGCDGHRGASERKPRW